MSDNRRWIALGAVTVVAAVLALLSNFFLGRYVAVPEGAVVPARVDPALAGGEQLSPEGADPFAAARPAAERGGLASFAGARRLSEEQYLEGILGRNIFDMDKIGVVDAVGEGAEGDPTKSDLDVALRGTVVANPAAFSAAFILERGKKTFYAYGIGQKIKDAEILEIEEDRVRIRRADGREEYLTVSDEEPGKVAPTAAAAAPAEGDEDVTQVDENHYAVDRDMLERYLDDLEGLSRMGRALLHRGPDGNFDGYRLSAIRRGSLPDKLGIRNGDIIHSVNGMELNSVQGAMSALQALQNENGLEFKVTRRGQPVDLQYDVR